MGLGFNPRPLYPGSYSRSCVLAFPSVTGNKNPVFHPGFYKLGQAWEERGNLEHTKCEETLAPLLRHREHPFLDLGPLLASPLILVMVMGHN